MVVISGSLARLIVTASSLSVSPSVVVSGSHVVDCGRSGGTSTIAADTMLDTSLVLLTLWWTFKLKNIVLALSVDGICRTNTFVSAAGRGADKFPTSTSLLLICVAFSNEVR